MHTEARSRRPERMIDAYYYSYYSNYVARHDEEGAQARSCDGAAAGSSAARCVLRVSKWQLSLRVWYLACTAHAARVCQRARSERSVLDRAAAS
jgi:hypothetical protein